MKFCNLCNSCMRMDVIAGVVTFTCCCKNVVIGGDEDACIYNVDFTSSDNIGNYSKLLRTIAADPTINTIYNECKMCHRSYMGLIRITENELVFKTCICGHIE